MALEPNKIAEQGKQLWQKLPPQRKAVLVLALVGTMAVVAYTSSGGQAEHYATLYSGLSPEDAGEMLEYVKAQKVPYQIEANGAALAVPESRVHEIRLQMASSGLPRGGGVGFEVFDKQTFGTTSFVEQVNYRRALQGELARTIMSLQAVERARVHIAMKERSLYRSEDEPPSASVVVHMRPGRQLAGGQVKGIIHLVSSSIEGLSPTRVTVVDDSGAVLASGDDASAGAEGQHELERTLQRRVSEIVDRVVGPGHGQVSVTAEMDYAKTDRTEELYDKDKIALRSEAKTVEGTAIDANVGGVAGSRGNLPGAPAPTGSGAGGNASRLSETRNYEVNHTVTRTVNPAVRLKRLQVAVLIDSQIKNPPSKEQLAQISALARAAAGLDTERGDKIEVYTAPFAATPVLDELPVAKGKWPLNQQQTIMAGGAAALVILLSVIFLGMGKRQPSTVSVNMPQLPAKVSDIESVLPSSQLGLPGPSPRDRVLEAVRSDSERAAKVVAAWLAEQATATTQGGNS